MKKLGGWLPGCVSRHSCGWACNKNDPHITTIDYGKLVMKNNGLAQGRSSLYEYCVLRLPQEVTVATRSYVFTVYVSEVVTFSTFTSLQAVTFWWFTLLQAVTFWRFTLLKPNRRWFCLHSLVAFYNFANENKMDLRVDYLWRFFKQTSQWNTCIFTSSFYNNIVII